MKYLLSAKYHSPNRYMKSHQFIIILLCITHMLRAEDDFQKVLLEGIQQNPQLFEKLEIQEADKPTDFSIDLGKSTLSLKNGDVFDGFRFVAPEKSEELDFIWYFNAPNEWGHWYICPEKGDLQHAFRNWINADKGYKLFDDPTAKNRLRVLQTLGAGYFKGGETYIMWFRKVEEGGEAKLNGRFAFKKSQDKWDHEKLEKELNLQPLPPAEQVKILDSRGGKVLLDPALFEASYAAGRIDSVFFSLRQTKRIDGGFFITIKTGTPPCKNGPSYADIVKKYGPADFTRTSKEIDQLKNDEDEKSEEDLTIFHYDHFGFEVKNNDQKKTILRVTTHAVNYSTLREENTGASFGQLSMENLTVFHDENGLEVGRMYYFMEGDKKPVSITAPPKGKYKKGNQTLECLGNKKWVQHTHYEGGAIARTLNYEEHRLNGLSKGYYKDGKIKYTASYQEGSLDGEVIEYSNDGKIVSKSFFKNGTRVLPET